MSRDLVPWVFVILLMAAEGVLAVAHAQTVAECRSSHTMRNVEQVSA